MLLRATIFLLLALLPLQAQKKKNEPDEVMRPNPAAVSADSPAIATCPAGGPLGEMDMKVKTVSSDQPLPFLNIVHLSEGDVVEYAPVLQGRERRDGEIALVLVPTKISGKEQLIVTDSKDAAKPQEWKIPRTVALAVLVYGPQGLSKKKVRNFLSQDDSLVAQMADYADKTAQTEALISALSNSDSSSASINAALTGFASQYGVAAQIDKTAPPAVQAQTLFSTINPQLASYSPLAATNASRATQTVSLATTAATLFFGSPVGLLAGGTSMLLDLRSIAFPDTQFRSAFAQPAKNSSLQLCGERGATPARSRIAYIWAIRIPNTPTPRLQIDKGNFIPVTAKSPVPVETGETEWKYLQHARNWVLEDGKGQRIPVTVLKLQNQKSIEIDLTKATPKPGDYQLSGYWDWVPFHVSGSVHVLPLSDFTEAHLEPASQDRLLAKGGKIPITVVGGDFEFATKVELKKIGDEFADSQAVRFVLPKGLRQGPQEQMDVQIDTHDLEPGRYNLLISQGDAKSKAVEIKILTNPPKVNNFPVIANAGVQTQHYVLKGERLDALTKLEAPGVSFDLGAASAGNSERNITVQMQATSSPGTTFTIKAYAKDRSEPVTFPDALRVTGPLPAIASSKLTLPAEVGVATRGDEFPAGYTISGVLDVKNIEAGSVLELGCAGGVGATATLRVGQQTPASNLQRLSPDQLFLSFDTSTLPAGCVLQAVVNNGSVGKSPAYQLTRIVRIPQIDSFTSGGSAGTAGEAPAAKSFEVKGKNLEMIEKAGWDATRGVEAGSLPTPIPGEGQKQLLRLRLPEAPGPNATLFLWLRGDAEGRATTVKYTPATEPGTPVEAPGAAHPQSATPAPAATPAPVTPPSEGLLDKR